MLQGVKGHPQLHSKSGLLTVSLGYLTQSHETTILTLQPLKNSPCHVPCEISTDTTKKGCRPCIQLAFHGFPPTGAEKVQWPQAQGRQKGVGLLQSLPCFLSHATPACHSHPTCAHIPQGPSPSQTPAPCEGSYSLTRGPGSWFQSAAAEPPIQLRILGFLPGTLWVLPEYSLPCSSIANTVITELMMLVGCVDHDFNQPPLFPFLWKKWQLVRAGTEVHSYNLSIQESEAGGSRIQDRSELQCWVSISLSLSHVESQSLSLKFKIFKRLSFFNLTLCVQVFCLPACMQTKCKPNAQGDQKKVLGLLELGLRTAVSHHVAAGNWPWILYKNKCSWPWATLQQQSI